MFKNILYNKISNMSNISNNEKEVMRNNLMQVALDPQNYERLRIRLLVVLGSVKPSFSDETPVKKFYEILKNSDQMDIELYKNIIEELLQLSDHDIRVSGFLQVLSHKITSSSNQ